MSWLCGFVQGSLLLRGIARSAGTRSGSWLAAAAWLPAPGPVPNSAAALHGRADTGTYAGLWHSNGAVN